MVAGRVPPFEIRVLRRREREIHDGERPGRIGLELRERAVVVVVRVDPVIGLRQAEFCGRRLEADVDAEVADARLHLRQQRVVAGGLRHLARQQARKRIDRAGIGDHAARLDLVPVIHAHAARATVAHQDFLDARVGEHLAARRPDARDDGVRDAPRAAHRIEAAVQVVARDQCLDHERRAFRRQAHVAPLAREHRDQFGILREFRQHLPRRAVETLRRRLRRKGPATAAAHGGNVRSSAKVRMPRDTSRAVRGSGRSRRPRAGSGRRGCRGTPRARPPRRTRCHR